MARIRTIKPQFWTDEKIGKLPIGARLLFIGLWNLADDEGIVLWNASYIRGQLFPYDVKITMVSIKQWMDHIASLKLVVVLEDAQKNKYGFIRAWHKHQVINRPQPTDHQDILAMITNTDSLNNHGALNDDSLLVKEWKGMEGNGEGDNSVNEHGNVNQETNKKIYGEFHNVFLTDNEVTKLKAKFNNTYQEKIENCSQYLAKIGTVKAKQYHSHYATILTWERNDAAKLLATKKGLKDDGPRYTED